MAMEWLPDEKTREMDRLYRLLILQTLLIGCFVVIIAYFFFPRNPDREPIKAFVLFAVCAACGLSVAFWGRSKVKKSGIDGGELLAYWSRKPLSRIVQIIIVIGIIVNIYRAVKGH
jgi:FtsH-binding integral membrane protein